MRIDLKEIRHTPMPARSPRGRRLVTDVVVTLKARSPSLKLSLPSPKSARLVTGWTSSTSARADQLVTTQDRMVAELEALHSLLRSLLEAAQQAPPEHGAR